MARSYTVTKESRVTSPLSAAQRPVPFKSESTEITAKRDIQWRGTNHHGDSNLSLRPLQWLTSSSSCLQLQLLLESRASFFTNFAYLPDCLALSRLQG
jgi:hypothetical protein